MDPEAPLRLLTELLGEHGSRPLTEPPVWPSDVADDHTPVEFSIAWNEGEPPALRILAEAFAPVPSVRANALATDEFLRAQAARYGLSTRRLDAIRDLFDTATPHGDFVLWISLVFRNGRPPEFKVYFNPEVHGPEHSPAVVEQALDRLGLAEAYTRMVSHAVRPGELARADRLTFFALDLHDGPQARVKLYLSHHDAQAGDVARAAAVVDGVDPELVTEFCELAGRAERFTGRPLIGSYTITQGAERPNGYSVYVPIRSYVGDDREARERVLPMLARYRFDPAVLDRAIDAVTDRPLDDGVGLIAHVSLRLGPPRPGMTVYLSAEAYQVQPPRPLPMLA
ncbi:tryptophan dimethylallyltransferase family protein [Actinoplanes sp. DH11]|uniref:tryptophan dimethylallyltransferase family protein n=1 Tax=Actinoplanes sp. DH11 TaxID=2857011 RepID=UPI001E5D0D8C|nr:tryptophan dimethylallyltransferase family protein [Actinoplanes sp. DH11]